MKKIILSLTIIILVIIMMLSVVYFIRKKRYDYKLLTSSYTLSGLVNIDAYVVPEDINPGEYKICTKGAYVNYSISEYDKDAYNEYLEEGINYTGEKLYSSHLDKYSCEQIELKNGTVLEGTNKDWGKVEYYLKRQ